MFDSLLNINLGGRVLRPTDTEQKLAGAGLAALVLGWAMGSGKLQLAGALTIAGVAYSVYEEGQLFVAPETMNSHFLTAGEASAMNGPVQAAQLADVFRTNGRRSSSAGSYGPGRGRGHGRGGKGEP